MTSTEPRQQAQAAAEQLLSRCTRTLVPVTEVPPAERGTCYACGRPAVVRVSMRLDGAEMMWANACAEHQDNEMRVQVSAW